MSTPSPICEHGMTTCPPCGFPVPPDLWPGVAFWDCTEDAERLHHESDEAAVDAFLDDMEKGERPTSVTVYGWKKMPVEVDGLRVLEGVLETLDEEHGDPDGDAAVPNEAMEAAARAFAEVVEREFQSWSCERVLESDHDVEVRWVGDQHYMGAVTASEAAKRAQGSHVPPTERIRWEGEKTAAEKDTGNCRECHGRGTVSYPGEEQAHYPCPTCRPEAAREAKKL